TLRRAPIRLVEHAVFHVARLQPLADQLPRGELANDLQELGMIDVVEGPFDVRVEHPQPAALGGPQVEDTLDGIMWSTTRPEPVAAILEFGLPERFKSVL